MTRMRRAAIRLQVWMDGVVPVTRGGVVLVIVGFVLLAVATVVGVVQIERLSDRQLRSQSSAIEALALEASVRETALRFEAQTRAFEACEDAAEGRMALRATMTDLYDAVEEVGGPVLDELIDEQRRLLDERRPPLDPADCVRPEPPEPIPLPPISDGDD